MKCKHYDNKHDLIARLKSNKVHDDVDTAVAATFSAYMMLATLTLHEDLGFGEEQLRQYVDGIYKRIEEHERGTLTVDDMEKTLLEKAGVVVEPPRIGGGQ